ncbi:MAG: 2Fe-2S iron-sulfur cluster-binding protein [Planctomycetota bacterium]|jgi:hypothetical protein
MPRLTIDGRSVEVPEGSTLLEASRRLDIGIPTLCFGEGVEPAASCMVCVVMEKDSGRLLPACSARAEEGMAVDTRADDVQAARKEALALLLEEHVGDCEGPCRRACPAHMDIPRMIRQIAAGNLEEALVTVKRDIALPAVLGRVCHAPCERVCRRSLHDEPVAICLLKRAVADADLERSDAYVPPKKAATGKSVAVLGAGPTGLAAAYYLLQEGHGCTLIDGQEAPGGTLRTGVPEASLPREVLDREIETLARLGAVFRMGERVGADLSMGEVRSGFDAVVIATGEVGPDAGEVFGVETTARGIRVARPHFRTSDPAVFAGGNALHAARSAIRAVAHGKSIALEAHRFLTGGKETGKRFDSRIGPLREGEIGEWVKEADPSPRNAPKGEGGAGFSREASASEASRCLRCDCRKALRCRLRDYAEEYGAKPGRRDREERGEVVRDLGHGEILFEPGKCIRCGVCVRIT